ncbi:hypothetical protein CFOL_v3_22075 [Cephalotus follicularis]|uniref:Uncharacterized protein n=1 Tax=Cephalotus follicularis TaxID=3775 RepID=A0A1Q3CEE4_CEPFO|nr:hypothetical protein CFOL_v3_22075 [Cephalotus follicularis]
MDSRALLKRRRKKSLRVNCKPFYRLLSWYRKASPMRFKKKKTEEEAMKVKRMEADVAKLKEELEEEKRRLEESRREVEEAFRWIARKREQIQMRSQHDAAINRVLDIIEARGPVSLTRSFKFFSEFK